MGVFAANAAREFTKVRVGIRRYAIMRGETNPDWVRHLDTNPRTYFKRSMGYLRFVAMD
jgi:hypothetical protein